MTLNNCTKSTSDRALVSPHSSNATACYESTENSELDTDIYHLQAGDMQCPYCNSSAQDLEMLRQELYDNESKLELAAKYGQNLLIENQELRTHIDAINAENLAIIEEKDGRFHELRLQMDRMRGDYESRLGSLEAELNYARAELDEKLAQLDKLNTEKLELKNDIIAQRSSFMDTIKQRDELEQDLKLEILEVRNQLASTEKTMIDDRRKERSSASEKDVLNDRLEEYQSKLKKALYENTLFSNRCDVLKSQLDESQSHIESLSSQLGDLTNQREKGTTSVEMDQNISIDCSDNSGEKNVQKRNKMFLSPGRESKSFGDFGKLRRQDEVDRMRGLETTQGDEDDEVEILALQGNSQDMWENYVEVIESDDEDEQDAASQYGSRQRKSWLEESSQLESFHQSDSNSTLSTSDEIEQEMMEKILSEISHIGAKTKCIIDYCCSRQKSQVHPKTSEKINSKIHRSDGESSLSLETEHQANSVLRAEFLVNETNDEQNYWSAMTSSSGSSLVASQSMTGAEQLQNDGNNFTTASASSFHQTVSLVNRKNFLDLVATELEKLKQLVNQTIPVESVQPESASQENRAVSALSERMDFLQSERDEALRKLRETEEKVKQLQDDLDKAIRSKEQLYHQLDELQCGDLSTYTSQKQSTNSRTPPISSIASPNSPGKFTRYSGRPVTSNSQNSSGTNNPQQSYNSRRVVSPRKSQQGTPSTGGSHRRGPRQQELRSQNVSSGGARSSGSTSDFIEADYQSGGSSIANSPMSSLPVPLVSRTMKLPLSSHSSFSAHDANNVKSQNVQYVLLGDSNQGTKSVSRRFSFWR